MSTLPLKAIFINFLFRPIEYFQNVNYGKVCSVIFISSGGKMCAVILQWLRRTDHSTAEYVENPEYI